MTGKAPLGRDLEREGERGIYILKRHVHTKHHTPNKKILKECPGVPQHPTLLTQFTMSRCPEGENRLSHFRKLKYRLIAPLNQIEYGFGYITIRSPSTTYFIYLRGTYKP